MRHIYLDGYGSQYDYMGALNEYERATMDITPSLPTLQVGTCKFNLRHVQPPYGAEVIIEDDSLPLPGAGRLFAGRVVTPNLDHSAGTPGPSPIPVWETDCNDYTFELDAAYVVGDYTNWTADQIFINICQAYCPQFTYTGVQTPAPLVAYIQFNYVKVTDCFKQLCTYCGWQWQVDFYRNLSFYDPATMNAQAPMTLNDTFQGNIFRNWQHKVDITNLRNRVYVKGGSMKSNPISPPYQIPPALIDGVTTSWTLPYSPSDLGATVDGTVVSVGVENQDTESLCDFMYNTSENLFRCSAQTPAPTVGTTILLVFTYPIDIISVVDDFDSQAACAAMGLGRIEGGVCTGVFEYAIDDSSMASPDAAEARGNADLRQYSDPVVTGQFDTDVKGWYPGQLLPIASNSRGIFGAFIVQHYEITWPYPTSQQTTVYYGGTLKSMLDTLQAMIAAQQTAATAPSVIQKISYMAETNNISDGEQMYLTQRVPPWQTELCLEDTITPSIPGAPSFSRASVAYDYLTGAQVASGVPRYDAGKFNQALMFEEGTTNLALYSSDLTNAAWGKGGTPTVSYNAPYSEVVSGVVGSSIDQTGFTANGGAYSLEIVAKAVSGTPQMWIGLYDATASAYLVSSSTKTLSTSGETTFSISVPSTTNGHALQIWIWFATLSGQYYVRSCQLEAKAYSTSCMETTSTTLARANETLTIPTAGVFTQGNWAVEMVYIPKDTVTVNYLMLWQITIDGNNYYQIYVDSTGVLHAHVKSGGTDYPLATAAGFMTVGSAYEIMFSGDGSHIRLCVNGSQVGSDLAYAETLGTLPTNMYIGCDLAGIWQCDGLIDDLRISNRARTLAEHQAYVASGLPQVADSATTALMRFDGNLDLYVGFSKQYTAVGSELIAQQQDSDVWPQLQYNISTDDVNWGALIPITPGSTAAVPVIYPGYFQVQGSVKAFAQIKVRNYKKPIVETDAVCGFVSCG